MKLAEVEPIRNLRWCCLNTLPGKLSRKFLEKIKWIHPS
jgi:hypothetical protein